MSSGAAMLLSMRPISGCRRDAHIDAVVAYPHSHRPQAIFGVTAVAAGLDVEFPAVPGADDVALLGETQAAAGLVRCKLLLDARDHLALTHRTAVVRAMILVGYQPVAFPKNSKLEGIDTQHAVAAIREFVERAHHDLVHRFTHVVLAPSFAFAAAVPHLKIEEVEVGRAHDRADRGHRLGCVHGSVA